MLVTTAPRGGLQLMQPANASDSLLKAYARDFHAEDRLTWQTVLKGKPMRLEDAWSAKEVANNVYGQEFMKRNELAHVVTVPLVGPVWEGYPAAMHLGRSASEGAFSQSELSKLLELARSLDEKAHAQRDTRKTQCEPRMPDIDRPKVRLAIIDTSLKAKTPIGGEWSDLDDRLRNQMSDQARRRLHQLNGEGILVDRVLLPDSDGESWSFRVVSYKRYPAIADGPISMFCLQPDCCEWGTVRPTDFQADSELSRLLPALRFMAAEFHRGPTLVEIAKQVDLSPFHFHRRFTELLGLTPKQFLLDCQIHQAKADLLARDKELVQIAKECGFAHQSHFTSRFKQATGLTPTRWRRMATAREQSSNN